MTAADIPHEIQNFWVPVAQIVPVMALALVIEARLIASHWKLEQVVTRRLQSSALLVAAILLPYLETAALGSMRTGTSNPTEVLIASIGLSILMIVVVGLPIQSLALAANVDTFVILSRLWPGSEWQKVGPLIRDGHTKTLAAVEEMSTKLDDFDVSVLHAKAKVQIAREYVGDLQKITATMSDEDLLADELGSRLAEAIQGLESARLEYKEFKRFRKSTRKQFLLIVGYGEEFEALELRRHVGTMSAGDVEFMNRVMRGSQAAEKP